MLKNAKQVLKQANYYISYEYCGNNHAEISISFKSNTKYKIKYSNGYLFNEYKGSKIKLPIYACSSFADIYLNEICQDLGYDSEFVHHTMLGSPVSSIRFGDFDVDDAEGVERVGLFFDIYKDVWQFGVKPQHVSLAKEFKIYDGFKKLCKYYLGVTIGN